MRLSCPTPSTSALLSHFFPLLVSSSASSASPQGAHGWTDHLGWLSNPWSDNGWHGWVSISSGCHANVFVLQVAPVDVHGGHVKDLPSLLLPFSPPRAFSLSLSLSCSLSLSHCLSVCVSCSRSFFFCVMTQESSLLLCGSSSVGITCMAWSVTPPHPTRGCTINTPYINGKKLHPACRKFKSTITLELSEIRNLLSTLSCLYGRVRGESERQKDRLTLSTSSSHSWLHRCLCLLKAFRSRLFFFFLHLRGIGRVSANMAQCCVQSIPPITSWEFKKLRCADMQSVYPLCVFTHPCRINGTRYSSSQKAHIKPLTQRTPLPALWIT